MDTRKFSTKTLSWLIYSWKLHLKRNVEYIISKDIGSALVDFLLKSEAIRILKVFSVKADCFFNWGTEPISWLLVRHLVSRLLSWILEWLHSRHFRKQISNSQALWVQEGQKERIRQEESHLKVKAGGKYQKGKGRSTVWKISSYQEVCFRASFVIIGYTNLSLLVAPLWKEEAGIRWCFSNGVYFY